MELQLLPLTLQLNLQNMKKKIRMKEVMDEAKKNLEENFIRTDIGCDDGLDIYKLKNGNLINWVCFLEISDEDVIEKFDDNWMYIDNTKEEVFFYIMEYTAYFEHLNKDINTVNCSSESESELEDWG